MPFPHLLLAILVVVIWGLNFLFVKLGLDEISPLLLCAMRFFFASVPVIFFIKPPAISAKIIIAYGIVMFALQFAFLFVGMNAGMTPGMASLVMQVQVFFSMFFAAILLAERPSIWQITGAIISFSGIGVLIFHLDKNISMFGFIFILAAAATWGMGNLITKKANTNQMISLVIWGSFVAFFPMFILSLIFEGPALIIESYQSLTWLGILSVCYIVYFSTWIGYGLWNWLLTRYSVGTIVPFTLLVPVVGILSSVLILDEPFETWKLSAGLLVIGGLCVNLLGSRLFVSKAGK